VQIILNCFRLKPLEQVLPAARAAGVGIIARVPLASGMLSMPTFNSHVPENIRADGMMALEAVKSGARHPFDGPVVDKKGVTKVAAGKNMPDGEIAGLNWYTQGVEGDLRS